MILDFLKNNFIYLFLAVLGLPCCASFSLAAVSQATLLFLCAGFSLCWLLLLPSAGFRVGGLRQLRHLGSAVAAPGL